jgi:TFIIF-interacting CTD phosphatase-like protein
MKRVGELYEVVVFTASVSKVGIPSILCCLAAC